MSQDLYDLNEALVTLALARQKCLDDSPYGWNLLFHATRHIERQIDPGPRLAMSELVILRNLMASQIADENTHPDVAASLRYARVHILQAIRHQAARHSEVAL